MKTNQSLAIIAALVLHATAIHATVFTTNVTIAVGNTIYDGQDIMVSNCTLTVNGPHTFNSFSLLTNAILKHTAAPKGETDNHLVLTVLGDVTVAVGGRIDVNYLGYGTAAGPGAGSTNASGYGSGAGHGGNGGRGVGSISGGGGYDSILTPSLWGSGGASGSIGMGGSGGGCIQLTVAGTLQLDGVITADGTSTGYTDGSGAGGSIQISAGKLAGSGLISAQGGSAFIAGIADGGGGGSGGRIALYFNTNNFTGSITAAGGTGHESGGAGTIYTKLAADAYAKVLVDNGNKAGQWTPLTTPEPFALVISNQAHVYASAPLTNQTLTVASNGQISCVSGQSNVSLTVLGDVTVAVGGRIDVNYLGYGTAAGPGAGSTNASGYGSGAGHGGNGGRGVGSISGGGGYDSILTPSLWGSGGASGSIGMGGSGGGCIQLTVAGTLQLDGVITADGTSTGYTDGSGAGGSIQISAGKLAGSGLISAQGGSAFIAGIADGGGGGSGGRIALYFNTNNFTGSITAAGGTGHESGGAGTIYTKLAADAYAKVLVDNGGRSGLTRLNSTFWPAGQVFDLTLSGSATVKPDEPLTFMNLLLTNGATLSHDAGQSGFFITALGNAFIATNASINVNYLGYGTATGPGAGSMNTAGYGSGAGHGGAGQASAAPSVPGGGIYGSATQPITLGSGGGVGGAGGGAIRLTVAGTLQLDGAITANGQPVGPIAGAGSGGSIWITADTLAGSGSVSALGGTTDGWGSRAGGGGRIAIYTYNMAGFNTNNISLAGWASGTLQLGYPPPQPITTVTGSALRVTWRTGSGGSYQVWSSPDLINWSLYGPVRTGTGDILTQDCPMTNWPGLFFRVQMGN